MHSFEVHSNESARIKKVRHGLEQVNRHNHQHNIKQKMIHILHTYIIPRVLDITSLSPRTYFILLPHLIHVDAASLSLFAHASIPSQLDRSQRDRTPGRRPHLSFSTAGMHFDPILGVPRISLREHVTDFPRPVAPPLPYSTYSQVPVIPRSSPV